MAEIQQFNLGQLLGQAEAIKGARRQNQLADLMAPIQQQSAQLGLDQARLGQTQQLAKGALAILGDNPQANWGQAIEFVRSRGGDVTGIEQYSPQNYELAKQLASGATAGGEYGKQLIPVRDKDGNLRLAQPSASGEVRIIEDLTPVNLAPEAMSDLRVEEEGRKRDVNIARDMGQAAYKRAQVVGESLPAYDRAIELVESGQANTGRFANLLPTITAGTAELENVALQLGLSTIQAVTFGALSEKEMEAALASNIPTNLPPPELAEFLRNRRDGQRKLYRGLLKQSIDLSSGRKTLADIAEEADRNLAEMERKNEAPIQQPAPAQQPPAQGGIDSILNRYR